MATRLALTPNRRGGCGGCVTWRSFLTYEQFLLTSSALPLTTTALVSRSSWAFYDRDCFCHCVELPVEVLILWPISEGEWSVWPGTYGQFSCECPPSMG